MSPDLSKARWRKSSRSGGEGTQCVELAWSVGVRDSKNPSSNLRVPLGDLLEAVKTDQIAR